MKRVLSTFILVALTTTIACGDDFEGPAEGTWSYTDISPINDECNVGADIVVTGQFVIEDNGDGSFHVDTLDSQPNFDCTLSGSDFTCPNRIADSYEEADTTLTWHVDTEGSFDGPTFIEGTQSGVVECSGSQCSFAEQQFNTSFPCQLDTEFVAAFQE